MLADTLSTAGERATHAGSTRSSSPVQYESRLAPFIRELRVGRLAPARRRCRERCTCSGCLPELEPRAHAAGRLASPRAALGAARQLPFRGWGARAHAAGSRGGFWCRKTRNLEPCNSRNQYSEHKLDVDLFRIGLEGARPELTPALTDSPTCELKTRRASESVPRVCNPAM